MQVNAALRRQVQKLQAEREELQQDRETALQSKETWKHKAQRHEAGLAEAHAVSLCFTYLAAGQNFALRVQTGC